MAEGNSDAAVAPAAKYTKAFAALEEVNLQSLFPFFKYQGLMDNTLLSLQSEEELNELLAKKLQPFASLWFKKYHGNIGNPRPFGTDVGDFYYEKGIKLKAIENREKEFKSFSAPPPHVGPKHSLLTWLMMEKAKDFICGCLNADREGVIYFGVGDQDGEILGLEIEDMKDEIVNAFQAVLNDHIISDAGRSLSIAEQDCIKRHFIPVKSQGNPGLYVIEIEVARNWKFCEDNIYYSKEWKEKKNKKENDPKGKALKEFFDVTQDKWHDAHVRLDGQTSKVKKEEVDKKVKKPLQKKYKEWKSNANQDFNSLLTEEESIEERRKQICTEKLILNIHEEVGTCWKQLAPELDFNAAECENIAEDHKYNVDKGNKLLIKWMQRETSKATVGRLAGALEKIGKKQFAEKLLDKK